MNDIAPLTQDELAFQVLDSVNCLSTLCRECRAPWSFKKPVGENLSFRLRHNFVCAACRQKRFTEKKNQADRVAEVYA